MTVRACEGCRESWKKLPDSARPRHEDKERSEPTGDRKCDHPRLQEARDLPRRWP